ncbi:MULTISPECIES: hypothetical protein [unclassified Paenibacillus]|uniref:hypothetical protein n=1 Tax=unclassified Paenibacillus TaxID=185978 RepID=UPI001AEB5BB7|nr:MULTISPECIES: hypothetical protein [unclassified Paenibacillus]MBP1153231.1 hypothetical protein [Paenibacillus sp. PvP091]MBP1171386.1 hypothetical protein [Paenibacillus sp. PvR098]MBP2442414.1 hypothetical protein [Paenibacillus sp. PvP052]
MDKCTAQAEEIYIYNNEDINDVKEDATGEDSLSAGYAAEPLPSPSARSGDRP